jgi:hypothetical protein
MKGPNVQQAASSIGMSARREKTSAATASGTAGVNNTQRGPNVSNVIGQDESPPQWTSAEATNVEMKYIHEVEAIQRGNRRAGSIGSEQPMGTEFPLSVSVISAISCSNFRSVMSIFVSNNWRCRV